MVLQSIIYKQISNWILFPFDEILPMYVFRLKQLKCLVLYFLNLFFFRVSQYNISTFFMLKHTTQMTTSYRQNPYER